MDRDKLMTMDRKKGQHQIAKSMDRIGMVSRAMKQVDKYRHGGFRTDKGRMSALTVKGTLKSIKPHYTIAVESREEDMRDLERYEQAYREFEADGRKTYTAEEARAWLGL